MEVISSGAFDLPSINRLGVLYVTLNLSAVLLAVAFSFNAFARKLELIKEFEDE